MLANAGNLPGIEVEFASVEITAIPLKDCAGLRSNGYVMVLTF